MNLLSLLSFFSFLVFLYVGIYAYYQDPRARLNRIFFLLALGLAVWALAYTFVYPAEEKEICRFWHRVSAIGWCLVPALVLHFLFVLTGKDKSFKRQWPFLFLYLTGLVFLSRQWIDYLYVVDYYRTPMGWCQVIDRETLWFWGFFLYFFFCISGGLLLLFIWWRKSSSSREKKQARIIFFSALLASLLLGVSNFLFPYYRVSLPVMAQIILILPAIGSCYAIIRHRMLLLTPNIAAEQIISRISDSLVMLNPDGMISGVNLQSEALLGYSEQELAGRPLSAVIVGEWLSGKEFAAMRDSLFSTASFDLTYLTKGKEHIPVHASFSPILDADGELQGLVMLAHDMRPTRQMMREARERHLRESEERFRELVSNSSDIILILDEEGIVRYISPSVEAILDFRPEEMTGLRGADFIHPDDARSAGNIFERVVKNPEKVSSRKFRIRHKDGEWKIFEAIFKNLLQNSAVKGVVVNFRDITDREVAREAIKKAHDSLERRVKERTKELARANEVMQMEIAERREIENTLLGHGKYLAALHETTLSIMNRLDLMDLLQSIIGNATTLVDCSHGYIGLLEPDGTAMITRTGIGVFSRRIGDRITRGLGVVGKVWESCRPVVVDNYQKFPGRIPGSDLDVLRAMVGVPLKTGTRVVGVIGLARDEEKRPFAEEEITLLQQFAELASIALDNARLYSSVQFELNERRRIEHTLRESEEKYRTILDSIVDGYFEVSLAGDFLFFNNSLPRILGYEGGELIGMNNRKLMDEINAKKVFGVFNEVYKTGKPTKGFDWELIKKDGTKIYVEASVSLMRDYDNRPSGFRGVVRDITERKTFEKSLDHLAHHDILTGLPNRLLFNDRLNQALASANRNAQIVAVMFLDLDNFKVVNDQMGHDVGDKLLKEVSKKLTERIREIDTVARFGGDEFMFLLPDIKNLQDVEKVIKRMFNAFAEPFRFGKLEVVSSPSVGIAFFPFDGDNVETLLKNSDIALYKAKEGGKNTYRFFSTITAK